MTDINLTERQKRIQQYLAEFQIEEILGDLLNTLAHNLTPNPIIFMIKYLSNLCAPEVLKSNGIHIDGPTPAPNLAIVYPKFTKPSKNLFKIYLKPEVFLEIKNKKTAKEISLREMIPLGLENEDHPIGIFASDKNSYNCFSALFDPIIKELNKTTTIENQKVSYSIDIESLLSEEFSLSQKENQMLNQITIKIKRNLTSYLFNPYMNNDERKEVLEVVSNALKSINEDLQGIYPYSEASQEILNVLKDSFNKPNFNIHKSNNNHYSKNWPSNRAVALQKELKYCLLINKDEHIELLIHKNRDINFFRDIYDGLYLLQKLQTSLEFAFDGKYGFITTNPKYVGTALRIKTHIKVPEDRIHIFKTNLANLKPKYAYLTIKEIDRKKGMWMLKSTKTMGFTELELVKAFQKTINFLLAGVVDPGLENNREEQSIMESSKGYFFDRGLNNTETEISFFTQGIETPKYLKVRSAGSNGEFTFNSLLNSEIVYPTIIRDNFEILQNSCIIIRRNVDGFPFKSSMKDGDNNNLLSFLTEFAKALPHDLNGDILTLNDEKYEKTIQDVMEQFDLGYYSSKPHGAKIDKRWPYGTAVFKSYNSKLTVITNLEDHFIIIYEFSSGVFANSLQESSSILNILEKKALNLAYHKEFGYITVNSEHTGSAIEIIYNTRLPHNLSDLIRNKPEYLNAYAKGNSMIIRANKINPKKIVALISFVCFLLQHQKQSMFEVIYQAKLKEIYGSSLIDKISDKCKGQPFDVLDIFNSNLEFQISDSLIYKELLEPYSEYILLECPSKVAEAKTKRLPDINLQLLPSKCPEIIVAKVEIGRNLEKYKFRQLMTIPEIEGLYTIVQNTFKNLKIEGQLFDYKEIYNMSSGLRSIFNSSFSIRSNDKVFVPINRRFACWINQLDHLRLVGQVSINELGFVLKEYEKIFSELESHGHNLLYDDKYGYISEKLTFCGLNLHLELQIITSKKRKEMIEEIFSQKKNWEIKVSDSLKQNQAIILLTSKGLFSVLDILNDVNQLIETIVNAYHESSKITENTYLDAEFDKTKILLSPQSKTTFFIDKRFEENHKLGDYIKDNQKNYLIGQDGILKSSENSENIEEAKRDNYMDPLEQRKNQSRPKLIINESNLNKVNQFGNSRKKLDLNVKLLEPEFNESEDKRPSTTGSNVGFTRQTLQDMFEAGSQKSIDIVKNNYVEKDSTLSQSDPSFGAFDKDTKPVSKQFEYQGRHALLPRLPKTTTNQSVRSFQNPSEAKTKKFEFGDDFVSNIRSSEINTKTYALPTYINKEDFKTQNQNQQNVNSEKVE